LLSLLEHHALPPHCIELELTENVLQTGRATVEAIRRLRNAGISIALDDFGTGYSSLASLEHLPLTRVKLDQSLMASIDTNARSLAITLAIADLCRQLGLEMTAEGVERPEQLALLLPHASICLQGFLISRPVGRTDLPKRVSEVPERLQSLLLSSEVLRRAGARSSSMSTTAIRKLRA
jgi:EAL domain-containing protein (putative c-di-GMP-specific phosphodiesterase class I)